jgi:hypothetical protein
MSIMATQMGLAAVRGLSGFAVGSAQASVARAMQEYQNTVSALAAAQALNVTTLNEIQAQDAAVRADSEIQRQLLLAEGQAKVSAGAAGVEGGSVAATLRGLRSSAGRAEHANQKNLDNQLTAFGQERRNTLVAKELNTDVSVMPRPSAASTLLGLGTNLLEIWDSHQTPSDTVAARLSGTQGSVVRS